MKTTGVYLKDIFSFMISMMFLVCFEFSSFFLRPVLCFLILRYQSSFSLFFSPSVSASSSFLTRLSFPSLISRFFAFSFPSLPLILCLLLPFFSWLFSSLFSHISSLVRRGSFLSVSLFPSSPPLFLLLFWAYKTSSKRDGKEEESGWKGRKRILGKTDKKTRLLFFPSDSVSPQFLPPSLLLLSFFSPFETSPFLLPLSPFSSLCRSQEIVFCNQFLDYKSCAGEAQVQPSFYFHLLLILSFSLSRSLFFLSCHYFSPAVLPWVTKLALFLSVWVTGIPLLPFLSSLLLQFTDCIDTRDWFGELHESLYFCRRGMKEGKRQGKRERDAEKRKENSHRNSRQREEDEEGNPWETQSADPEDSFAEDFCVGFVIHTDPDLYDESPRNFISLWDLPLEDELLWSSHSSRDPLRQTHDCSRPYSSSSFFFIFIPCVVSSLHQQKWG